MKQLTCEMCGGTDLIKQEGVFVCQNCGTKYSVEEAKKMMVEGTVEVQGTVKVDVSDKLNNLYLLARRAKDDNNSELASKYYEEIMIENPNDPEAVFYFNYYKAANTNLRNMENSLITLTNSLSGIFQLIDKSDKTDDEKWSIAEEIIAHIDTLCESFVFWAKSHYREFSELDGSISELDHRTVAIAELQKMMADLLEKHIASKSQKAVSSYLKSYVKNYLLLDTVDRGYVNITLEFHSKKLIAAEERIKAIEPEYVPLIKTNEQNKEDNGNDNQTATYEKNEQEKVESSNPPSTNNDIQRTNTISNPTGGDFYGPLIGYFLWAGLAGLMFFSMGVSVLVDMPLAFIFFLLLFICPCCLVVRLIYKKYKATHSHKKTSSDESSKSKKRKIGIICLSATVIIIVFIIAFNVINSNDNNSTIVGTWRWDDNPSSQVIYTDDGKCIITGQSVDSINTYSISGNKITINFDGINPITETYTFDIKGDKLIVGSDSYTRVK